MTPMTESQDVLAEFRRWVFNEVGVTEEGAWTQEFDHLLSAALVRTPETLDVAGLRREIEALPGEHECWDGDNFVERHTDLLDRAAVLAIVDRLAATPPPEPAIDVGRLARAIAEGDSIDEPAWFEYGKTTIRKMAAMFAAEYDRLGSEPRITPDELQDDLRDLERGSE